MLKILFLFAKIGVDRAENKTTEMSEMYVSGMRGSRSRELSTIDKDRVTFRTIRQGWRKREHKNNIHFTEKLARPPPPEKKVLSNEKNTYQEERRKTLVLLWHLVS